MLREYSLLIDTIEKYLTSGYERQAAIEMAVDECIEQGVLKDFLIKHRSEVIDSMYGDISMEEFIEIRKQEQYDLGHEAGFEEGITQGLSEGISQGLNTVAAAMKAKGMSVAEIGELTKLSKEQIEAL